MIKISAPLMVCCLLISGCRFEAAGDGAQNVMIVEKALPSNDEVLAKAYNSTYQAPDDFYVDERADTPGSFSLYHVKDQSVSFELCADSYAEAEAWEAADNASRAVNGPMVTSIANNRYFEFIRELAYPDSIGNISDPTSPGFARVFKCEYVNRDGVDRNLLDGYAGKLNARPLSEETIKTYSEYMWQFTFFWPARKKVLNSYSTQSADSYSNTLVIALITNQGDDRCDLVDVVEWAFSVDKTSGELSKSFRPVFQLEAHQVNGVPQECPG
jgi:hypothetical protein